MDVPDRYVHTVSVDRKFIFTENIYQFLNTLISNDLNININLYFLDFA